MTKEETTEKKAKEGKKASAKASKKAAKIKIAKGAEKILNEMASTAPMGQGKQLLQVTHNLDKLEADKAKIALAIRGERAKLKEMKIELRVYDHVRKLRKMDPEDQKSFKATEALYTEQLAMDLSPQQKEQIEEINRKRETARKAMAEVNGGDTGKEIGSAAGSETHTTETDGQDAAVKPLDDATDRLAAIPPKNDAITPSGFRAPAAISTH